MAQIAIVTPHREVKGGASAIVILLLSGDDPRNVPTIERARARGIKIAPTARLTGGSEREQITNLLNAAGIECIIDNDPTMILS